jgi:hypothetical protein
VRRAPEPIGSAITTPSGPEGGPEVALTQAADVTQRCDADRSFPIELSGRVPKAGVVTVRRQEAARLD